MSHTRSFPLLLLAASLFFGSSIAHAQSVDGSVATVAVAAAPVPPTGDVDVAIPIGAVATIIDAVGTHNWPILIAALLGLIAWALRRYTLPEHFFHTPLGMLLIALVLSVIGAVIPVLQSGRITAASLISAIATAAVATLAMSNPSALARAAKVAATTAPVLLLLMLSAPGCAAFQRQPVALQKAEIDALKCGIEGVQKGMVASAPTVLDALAGDAVSWKQDLAQQGRAVGDNVLGCAVAHALFDALGAAGLQLVADRGLEHAVEVQLMVAANDGGGLADTPRRRVLLRGLEWLRSKGYARAGVAGVP
jgi:hypothetical protein